MIKSENYAMYIKWEKRFELGIPVLDRQHKMLVSLCNELYFSIMEHRSAGMNKNWQQIMSKIVRKTVEYIKLHFADEEKIMEAVGYSETEEHKARHREFSQKVCQLLKEFDKVDFQTGIKFARFLRDWILQHIAFEDKLFVPEVTQYLKNRIKAS